MRWILLAADVPGRKTFHQRPSNPSHNLAPIRPYPAVSSPQPQSGIIGISSCRRASTSYVTSLYAPVLKSTKSCLSRRLYSWNRSSCRLLYSKSGYPQQQAILRYRRTEVSCHCHPYSCCRFYFHSHSDNKSGYQPHLYLTHSRRSVYGCCVQRTINTA